MEHEAAAVNHAFALHYLSVSYSIEGWPTTLCTLRFFGWLDWQSKIV